MNKLFLKRKVSDMKKNKKSASHLSALQLALIITGSIVARAAEAELYENWTDVSGMLMADPRCIENPQPIPEITYRELRELSYMGATVLHEDAIFPVRYSKIPINIRNTNRPEDKGTFIVESTCKKAKYVITGIAGKKGFLSITIIKKQKKQKLIMLYIQIQRMTMLL